MSAPGVLGKRAASSGYALVVYEGTLYAEAYTNNTATTLHSSKAPTGEWAHLAVTWRSRGWMRAYVNGQLVGLGSASALTSKGDGCRAHNPHHWRVLCHVPATALGIPRLTQKFLIASGR